MADVEEVGAALRDYVGSLIYPTPPNPGDAGANGAPTKIILGWPKPDDLAAFLDAGGVQVAVYPMPGMSKNSTLAINPDWVPVSPPLVGLSADIQNATVTFSGTATGSVNVLFSNGFKSYAYAAAIGASAASVAAGISALVAVDQPDASVAGAVLTVPSASSLKVEFGGATTMVREVSRTRQGFQIIVFAPTQALRVATSKIVQPGLRDLDALTLPDSTAGMIFWEREIITDAPMLMKEFRRDMVVSIDFPIVDVTDGYGVVDASLAITELNTGAQIWPPTT